MILTGKISIRNTIILLLCALFLSSCAKKDEKYSDSRIAMGTSVTITVYDKEDREYLPGAFDLIYEIERKISAKTLNSYISKINEKAGLEAVQVPEDVFKLIEYSLWISKETGNLFDPAIGALSEIWGIGSDSPKVPSEDEIQRVLPLLDPNDIVLDGSNNSVFLKKEGMKLDLGGIGKGYAADMVKEYLKSSGVERAIVNLGGNIYALGGKTDKDDWKIGISNPKNPTQYIALVDARDETVVTSGGYERYFEEDDMVYHHILNPKTGYPYDSNLLSASIITDQSILADALSTAVFAGGREIAGEISEKFGVAIIIYTEDKELITYGNL